MYVLRRNYHQLVTGVYGSGHLLLRVHRVRHHRDNRRGGAQPAEKHSEGHRRFAAHRAVRVRDEQLDPNVDRYAANTGIGTLTSLLVGLSVISHQLSSSYSFNN